MPASVLRLIDDALRLQRRVYVLVNNKAEGSAPLTIEALARQVAQIQLGGESVRNHDVHVALPGVHRRAIP